MATEIRWRRWLATACGLTSLLASAVASAQPAPVDDHLSRARVYAAVLFVVLTSLAGIFVVARAAPRSDAERMLRASQPGPPAAE